MNRVADSQIMGQKQKKKKRKRRRKRRRKEHWLLRSLSISQLMLTSCRCPVGGKVSEGHD